MSQFPSPVFQQIPALDAPFKISAIDYCDNKLYLGGEDSTIFRYLVKTDQLNNIISNAKDFNHCKIPAKGKIQAIKHLQYVNQILVHVDKQLYLFDGDGLIKNQDIVSPNQKDCEMFALDEDPRSVEKSLARLLVVRSDLKITFYEFEKGGKGQFVVKSESTKLQQRPSSISWFGKNIFIGFEKKSYEVMDYETKKLRDIESFRGYVLNKHMIKIISEEETLLLGPSDCFIPINSYLCDKLDQSPIQMMPKIVGITVLDPYIIVLGENKIQVYNKFFSKNRASRLLQEESYEASGSNIGKGISVTSNRVFFATQTKVYYLSPIPFDQQIARCLSYGRVDDALMVFDQYINENDPDRPRKLDNLKMDAAWVYFRDLKFRETEETIRDLNYDIKEFLALFFGYVPNITLFENRNNFTFGNITQDATKRQGADPELKKDPNRAMKAVRECLARLLENKRKYFLDNYGKNLKEIPEFITSENFSPFKDDIKAGKAAKLNVEEHLEIIDFALLKVYIDLEREDLLGPLLSKKLFCKDSVKELENLFLNERRPSDHILAKFFEQFGKYKEALEVWSQALHQPEKPKVDRACDEMIRILTTYSLYFKELKEKDVLFDYLAKVLRKNGNFARTFFMQVDLKNISPDSIQKKLAEKIPEMRFLNEILLEVLVNEKKIEDDKFHTNLATHYVKSIFDIKKKDASVGAKPANPAEEKTLNDYRRKLNTFLKDPLARYSPDTILSQIKDSWLIEEEIYLYGAIKQHNEALNKMLNLYMYNEAENYCAEKQERLLTKLFGLYIKKYNEYNELLKQAPDSMKINQDRKKIKEVIYTFLKKYASHPQLDPAAVVDEIPDDWKLGSDNENDDESGVFSFLFYSLSYTLHTKRNAKVAKYLSELDALDTQYKLLKAQSAHVTINSSRRCALCNRNLGRTMFVVYPNGVITHHTCSQDKFTVCPVTKQNFEKTFSG